MGEEKTKEKEVEVGRRKRRDLPGEAAVPGAAEDAVHVLVLLHEHLHPQTITKI